MGHKVQKNCRFYMNGNCTKGRFCKFLHSMNGFENSNGNRAQPAHTINGNRSNTREFTNNNVDVRNVVNQSNSQRNSRNTYYRRDARNRTQNRQCKYRENCDKFPNCGYAHYEICRYQNQCFKGPECRFVHLPERTFLDFCQNGRMYQ